MSDRCQIRMQAADCGLCPVERGSVFSVATVPAGLSHVLHILTAVSSFQGLKYLKPLATLDAAACCSMITFGVFAFLKPQLISQSLREMLPGPSA